MTVLASLPAKDADRLVKLAGMLGSDHDGEIVNAARACTSLLKRHHLTWADVVTPCLAPPAVPITPPRQRWGVAEPAPVATWVECHRIATYCLTVGYRVLTDWERQFCDDMRGRRKASTKQRDILLDIQGKVRRHMARDGADA